MREGQPGELHRQLDAIFHSGGLSRLSDKLLLERFSARRDESAGEAFAALVKRHGPMVLRVCQGVLRDPHDAEDAFQATFLILATKASSIQRVESAGSWLYGVALRVATDARSIAFRRRSRERRAAISRPEAVDDGSRGDVDRIVYEEVGRLPQTLREPVLLCYLEGRSCAEAAQQLGWPIGTVKTRLASARERLRYRFTRRGLVPAIGMGALSGTEFACPSVSSAMVNATVQLVKRISLGAWVLQTNSSQVLTLRQGVLNAMLLGKLKHAAFVLLVAGTLIASIWQGAVPASDRAPEAGLKVVASPQESSGRVYVSALRKATGKLRYATVALDPRTGAETLVIDDAWIQPRVSSNGRTIAFLRRNELGGYDLWSRSVAGADVPKRLLDLEGADSGCPPVWSPDGRQIVITLGKRVHLGGHPWEYATVRINADGKGRTRVNSPPEGTVRDWSSDGKWLLAFCLDDTERAWQMYVMRPDGSDRRTLTKDGNPFNGRFSPDGRSVLFTDGHDPDRRGVWVTSIDGQKRRRLLSCGPDETIEGCWSPDGKRIAAIVNDRYAKFDEPSRVELMDLDGGKRATFKIPGGLVGQPDWR